MTDGGARMVFVSRTALNVGLVMLPALTFLMASSGEAAEEGGGGARPNPAPERKPILITPRDSSAAEAFELLARKGLTRERAKSHPRSPGD